MKKGFLLSIFLIVFAVLVEAQTPTVQASNVTITSRTSTTLSVTWTRGNGNKCLVVCRLQSGTTSTPQNGMNGAGLYTGNTTFGNGENLGNNNYAISNTTGTSVTINGLTPGVKYRVFVYEYNKVPIFTDDYYYYNSTTSTANRADETTLCADPTSNSNFTFSGITYNSININPTPPSGHNAIVTLQNTSNGNTPYNPVDGTPYTADLVFGNGSLIGGDVYVVHQGGSGLVTVTNLMPATNYQVRSYTYCGSATGDTWNYRTGNYNYANFSTVNYQPSIDGIANIAICQDAGQTTINLSNITDGSTLENQNLTVTVSSSNTTLIPNANLSLSYSNPNTTGTLSFTPAPGQSGVSTITVTVDDGWSSNNTRSRSFVVTVNPIPDAAGAISGPTTVCKDGQNYVFSVPTIANATSYTWTYPSNAVAVSGANTNAITLSFPTNVTTTSYTIKVKGTNSFGCGDGAQSTFPITLDVKPTVSNAGADQLICNGTTQLDGNNPTVGTGVWTVNTGSASFNDNTQNNTNVTGIVSGQTVTLDWTITNGVCPASVDQVDITYDPSDISCLISANFFSSENAICVNAPVDFFDNSTGATSWSWNFGSGASPATSTLENPTGVTYSTPGLKTVYLQVSGPNGTDDITLTNYIEVIDVPGNAGVISGNTTVCESDEQVLYSISTVNNATDYTWTLPAGATINTGDNTESISVDYNIGSTSGTIMVEPSNQCGTGNSSSLSITVNPLPDNAGVISGPDTVCQGETGVTYTVGPITDATNYIWSIPAGASIVQNNTTSIVVDFTNSAISGNVSVYGTNSCGDGSSSSFAVIVNPLPGNAGAISGLTQITNCPSVNAEIYSIDSVAFASGYIWTLPTGATVNGPANLDSIYVDYAFGASSGTIMVTPENGCGNGASSSLSIFVDDPVTQNLCLATVDDNSDFNTLVWEKVFNDALAYYNIYREVTTNNYSLIGTVDGDSLSQYNDSVADPNVTNYKYKITAVDTCGNESPLSDYHSTIHLQFLGNGNLQWTLYEIENQSNPVSFYEIFRDDSSTGNWNSISNTIPGGNSTFTDTDYALFTNPSYRVDVIWAITCTSGRAGVNTSRSNIKNAPSTTVGVNESLVLNNIKLFPNPSHSTIQLTGINDNSQLTIYNNLGQLVSSEKINNNAPIDISNLPNGIYTVKVNWDNYIKVLKFIKN